MQDMTETEIELRLQLKKARTSYRVVEMLVHHKLSLFQARRATS